MREYYLRFEAPPTEGPDDLEEAREYFRHHLGQTEVFRGDKHFRVSLVDVQQLPREAGGNEGERVRGEDHSRVPTAGYPDDAPPHPWDQGLWIFPEDHPMHRYERLAKAKTTHPDPRFHPEGEVEKEVFLEAGQKMLTP